MKFILFWLLDENVLNKLVSLLKHTETKVRGSVHSSPQSAQRCPLCPALTPSTLSLKCGSAYQ